jgi:hypothetical protein
MGLLDQLFAGGVMPQGDPNAQEALLTDLFRRLQEGGGKIVNGGVLTASAMPQMPTADFMQRQEVSPSPTAEERPGMRFNAPPGATMPTEQMPVREQPTVGQPYSAPPQQTGHIMPEAAPAPMPERYRVASAPRPVQPELGFADQIASFNRAVDKGGLLGGISHAMSGGAEKEFAQYNATVRALTQRIGDPQMAAAIARDPQLMRAMIPQMFAQKEMNLEVTEIFDQQGRPQKALLNKRTGQIVPVGSPGVAKQDPVEMLTRREDAKEQAELRKADGKRIAELNEQADAARGQIDNIRNLRIARDGVSYEGGYLSGPRTWLGKNLPDVLPGNGLPFIPDQKEAGRAEAVESLSENVRLGFVEKTKGAVSDSEMRIFGAATPGMQMTDAGAQTIMDGMQAAADRPVERAKFYEAYRGQNKTLSGAQDAWDSYVAKNPIITADGKGGFTVNKGNVGNWRSYVGGEPQPAAAPAATPAVPAAPASVAPAPKGSGWSIKRL